MGGKTQAGMFLCNGCREKFTVRTGTVMERSHVPLHKWLLATHLMAASKKGMSAKQMERMLGVTYKTAWFLCHRIREAMDEANDPHAARRPRQDGRERRSLCRRLQEEAPVGQGCAQEESRHARRARRSRPFVPHHAHRPHGCSLRTRHQRASLVHANRRRPLVQHRRAESSRAPSTLHSTREFSRGDGITATPSRTSFPSSSVAWSAPTITGRLPTLTATSQSSISVTRPRP